MYEENHNNVLKNHSKTKVCLTNGYMLAASKGWLQPLKKSISSLKSYCSKQLFELHILQSFHGETEPASFSWTYEEIKEVHKRWWQLRDNAVEIFLTNGRTLLLAFDNTKVMWH